MCCIGHTKIDDIYTYMEKLYHLRTTDVRVRDCLAFDSVVKLLTNRTDYRQQLMHDNRQIRQSLHNMMFHEIISLGSLAF